jgi:hypothetical protein
MLIVVMLIGIFFNCYSECLFAVCHYAVLYFYYNFVCLYADCHYVVSYLFNCYSECLVADSCYAECRAFTIAGHLHPSLIFAVNARANP